jgi:hypothetical protein
VFEIAKEFGVPTKAVMPRSRNGRVRAVSLVNCSAHMPGKLWDHFQANQQADTDT